MSLRLSNTLLLGLFLFANYGHSTERNDKTDLGEENWYVSDRFKKFQSDNNHCQVRNLNAKRVILTGFGPFNSHENITGRIIEFIANKKNRNPIPSYGADIFQRRMQIEGDEFDVCFIRLDVVWDLAGAIIIDQMNRFRPESVFMTGIGLGDLVTLEAGGSNKVMKLNGFNHFGQRLNGNVPVSSLGKVLQDGPETLSFTWNRDQVSTEIEDQVTEMGYKVSMPSEARANNRYICNNVAFIVAAASEGLPISLAGGKINLRLEYSEFISFGFLHIPPVKKWNEESLNKWKNIMSLLLFYG